MRQTEEVLLKMEDATTQANPFLPDEVWIEVLLWLDLKSLVAVRRVNRRLYQLTEDEHVWRRVYCLFFSHRCISSNLQSPQALLSVTTRISWQERCQAAFKGELIDRAWKEGRYTVHNIFEGQSRSKLATYVRRPIYCARFDDEFVASIDCSEHEKIVFFDRQTLQPVFYLQGSPGKVAWFQFDKEKLISGSTDGVVRVWDLATQELVNKLQLFNVFHVQFDDRLLAAGGGHSTIGIWNLQQVVSGDSKQPILSLSLKRTATNQVFHLELLTEKMLSSGDDGSLKYWDIVRGECIQTAMHAHSYYSYRLQSDKNNVLVSGGGDALLKLWDLRAGLSTYQRVFEAEEGASNAFQFDENQRKLVAAGRSQNPHLWEMGSGKLITEYSLTYDTWCLQLDGPTMLTSGDHGKAFLWHFGDNPPFYTNESVE